MARGIIIRVTLADAIRAGELSHGIQLLRVDSWEGWTDEERTVLAQLTKYNDERRPLIMKCATVKELRSKCRRKIKESKAQKLAEMAMIAAVQTAAANNGIAAVLLQKSTISSTCSTCGGHHKEREVWSVADAWVANKRVHVHMYPDCLYREAKKEAARLNLIAKAEWDHEVAQHEAACAARLEKNEVKRAAKAEELVEIGLDALTHEQQERSKAGYLPDSERIQALRDWWFARCSLPWYVELTLDHHCQCCVESGDLGEVSYSDERAISLTAAQFAVVGQINKAFVSNKFNRDVVPIYHKIVCSDCARKASCLSVTVTLTFPKGNVLTKEYALPGNDQQMEGE